jgi:hypothetical protein
MMKKEDCLMLFEKISDEILVQKEIQSSEMQRSAQRGTPHP